MTEKGLRSLSTEIFALDPLKKRRPLQAEDRKFTKKLQECKGEVKRPA